MYKGFSLIYFLITLYNTDFCSFQSRFLALALNSRIKLLCFINFTINICTNSFMRDDAYCLADFSVCLLFAVVIIPLLNAQRSLS